VIAYGKGGALETVVGMENDTDTLPTGIFFDKQNVEALVRAIERFEAKTIDPVTCRAWAKGFEAKFFDLGWKNALSIKQDSFQNLL
jgi:hypothetical protein